MQWLNRKRILVYTWSLVTIYALICGYWYFAGEGVTDVSGKPLGSDYICFYAASALARDGEVSTIYDLKKIGLQEQKIVGGKTELVGWYYPPTFALIVYPLSFVSYRLSLFIWLITTLYLYVWVIRRIAPSFVTLGLTLSFPGTLQNIVHGQNGFLTAALLGGGLLYLQNFPILAGLLLGMLSFKPHLAVLVVIALTASRNWKALIAMVFSVSCLVIASWLAFGYDPWLEFKATLDFVVKATQIGYLPWQKMPTVLTAVRLLGFGPPYSYLIQGVLSVLIGLLVFCIWFIKTAHSIKASVCAVCIFLATPFAYQYDLTILALAIAWYGWECHQTGWLPYEKAVLFLMWLVPLINYPVSLLTRIQITPVMLTIFLVLAMRRIYNIKTTLVPEG